MFGFIKKGKELNKLANCFERMHILFEENAQLVEEKTNREALQELVQVLAFIATKGVNDRINANDIPLNGVIMVPSIKVGYVKVAYAYQLTVGKLINLANTLDLNELINEIMNKGEAYYHLDRILPDEITNK